VDLAHYDKLIIVDVHRVSVIARTSDRRHNRTNTLRV
jgi:hypothetical protein